MFNSFLASSTSKTPASPGPAEYTVVSPRTTVGYKVSKSPRITSESLPTIGNDSPGPQYDPKENLIRRRVHTTGISTEKREMIWEKEIRQKAADPGPGEYNPKSLAPPSRTVKLPKEAISLSWARMTSSCSPGPAAYNGPQSPQQSHSAGTIARSTSNRSQWLKVREEDAAPELPANMIAELQRRHESPSTSRHTSPLKSHLLSSQTNPPRPQSQLAPIGASIGRAPRLCTLEAGMGALTPGPADYDPCIINRPPKWKLSPKTVR